MSRILRNAAQCARCKQIIESRHRHDFVACECGSIFVDGGHEYLRCGGKAEDFISLVEMQDVDIVTIPVTMADVYDGAWHRDLYGGGDDAA